MVWPTLGSRTAKEQNRTEQNSKNNTNEHVWRNTVAVRSVVEEAFGTTTAEAARCVGTVTVGTAQLRRRRTLIYLCTYTTTTPSR